MNDESFSVSIRIFHKEYSCSKIKSLLPLPLNVGQSVGDARATPKGTPLEGKYRETYCSFSLINKRNGNFEDFLPNIHSIINEHRYGFHQIAFSGGRLELELAIFCESDIGFTLSAADLQFFASNKMSFGITIYP